MGDMTAKIGSNNDGLEHVMGRHGIGNMNERMKIQTLKTAGRQ